MIKIIIFLKIFHFEKVKLVVVDKLFFDYNLNFPREIFLFIKITKKWFLKIEWFVYIIKK